MHQAAAVRTHNAEPVANIYPAPAVGGRGIVFARFFCFFVSLFLCLFLCQQHYEKTAGPICMKFSGKVWSDHETM